MSFLWLVIILVAVLSLVYFAARRSNRRVEPPAKPRSYTQPAVPAAPPAPIIRSSSLSSTTPRSVAHHTTTQRPLVESTRASDQDNTLVNQLTTLAALQALDTSAHESRPVESVRHAYEPAPVISVVDAIEDDTSRYRTTGSFGGEAYQTSASIPDSTPAPSYSSPAPSYSAPSSSDYSPSSSNDYSSSSSSDSSGGGWSD